MARSAVTVEKASGPMALDGLVQRRAVLLSGTSNPELAGTIASELGQPLVEVVVTDTVRPPEKLPSRLTVVSVASLLASSIRAAFQDQSVSAIFKEQAGGADATDR